MNFFTSDLHFGHEKIIGYCNRPFSDLVEMKHELVRRWNQLVKPTDNVFVLGDFALYLRRREVEEILEMLNGEKHLRKGNHDHRDNYKANGWASVSPFQSCNLENGTPVCFIHNPSEVDVYAPNFEGIVLHGHLHGNKGMREPPLQHKNRTYFDVGVDVDANDYSPISEPEVLFMLNQRRS